MKKINHPACNYFLLSLVFSALLLGTMVYQELATPNIAKATACGTTCFMGYYLSIGNHGVEAHISTPTSFNPGPGNSSSSFLLANAQGPAGFIQIGLLNTASGGFCHRGVYGIITEHTTYNGNYHQYFDCNHYIAPGSTHTYAVQLDGTNPDSSMWTWDYTFDGEIIRRVVYNAEELTFSTLSIVVGYGETNGSTIQMGGPNPSSHSRISHIGYKSGYTGGFTYPAYPTAYDYAGVSAFDCGCPYGKTPGSDPSPINWWVDVWTK